MKTINSEIAVIDFNDSDAILQEKLFEDSEISLDKMKEHFCTVSRLTNNEKHVALIDASDLVYIDQPAIKYMAESFEASGRIAIAFYSNNLANRLALLCMKLIYKPAVPFEFFTNKAHAMEWLQSKNTIN